jgi:hypothetical protein
MPFIIAAAVVVAIGITGTVAAVATFVLGVAISVVGAIGLAAVTSALSPKPSNNAAWRGESMQVTFNPNDPRRYAIGDGAAAGQMITFQTWGNNNEFIILLFRLVDHKTNGLQGAWWNGTRITIDPTTGAVAEATISGTPYLWITYFNGDWNQAADSELITESGGRWSSSCRGRGITYVKVKARFNQTAHPQGLAGLFGLVFEIKGGSVYDRRLDSSVGGSGAQRANDKSTWAYSANAAVCTEALLRGIREEDTSVAVGSRTVDTFFGLSLTDTDLPFADNVAAMNDCDDAISILAGGTEPRYAVGGVVDCSQTPEQVLEDMCAAMAGKLLTGVGRWIMLPGVARTPVTGPSSGGVFLDTDFRIDGPASFKDKIPLSQVVNTVTGRFADPASQFTAQPLPTRTSLGDQAEDGGPKAANFDLTYVTSFTQGQRCMEIQRRIGRQQRSAQRSFAPEWIGLEPGDWVTWTSARLGFSEDFEVVQVQMQTEDDNFLNLVVDMGETDPSVYAWTPSTDELSRNDPTFLTSADTAKPAAPAGGSWSLSAITETDSHGATNLVLQFVGACDNPLAQQIVFRISGDGGTTWQGVGLEPARTTTIKRVSGLGGGSSWKGEVSYIVNGNEGDELVLSTVTTGPATPPAATWNTGDILINAVGSTAPVNLTGNVTIPSGFTANMTAEAWAAGGESLTVTIKGCTTSSEGASAGDYGKHQVTVSPGQVISWSLGGYFADTTVTIGNTTLTVHHGLDGNSTNPGAAPSASTGWNAGNVTGHAGGRVSSGDGGGSGPGLVDQTTVGIAGADPGGGASAGGGNGGPARVTLKAKA